jgi:hypothetical protein
MRIDGQKSRAWNRFLPVKRSQSEFRADTSKNLPKSPVSRLSCWNEREEGNHEAAGFFDLDERYQRLSESGDPLVKLGALVDFELFGSRLKAALKRSDGAKGARPMARC